MRNPSVSRISMAVMFVCVLTMVTCALCLQEKTSLYFNLEVHSSDVRGMLEHFWRSTGFCPPKPHQHADRFDASRDMVLNLALVGSVPHEGIEQVRIHWLFDLVKVTSLSKGGYSDLHKVQKFPWGDNFVSELRYPVYDFARLDKLLWILFKNNLKPGFELMGSPSNFFTDFENITQVYLWRDLVYQTAKRYINMFGISYIQTWNFETWNEPDCKDFDNVSMSVKGFLNYYDACSEGLRAANPDLVLGGPGDGCDHTGHSKYSDAFLDHIVNGRNFFTGEKGIRLDFLSYHRKGDGKSKNIIQREMEIVEKIKRQFPSLATKPFYNDEADPLVGWSKSRDWRADATYAAMVTKVISQHQNIILGGGASGNGRKFNFSLLSNDNAFLSWYPFQFTERTLNARFQMNNTKPPHVHLVRKPVHAAMVLLSLLGEQQVFVNLTDTIFNDRFVKNDSFVGVVATRHCSESENTRDSNQLTILLFNSKDTEHSANQVASISVQVLGQICGAVLGDTMVAGFRIDNNVRTGNPYLLWNDFGKPKYPSAEQFSVLHRNEGPYRYMLSEFLWGAQSSESLSVSLSQPSVNVLHFCTKPFIPPGQVTSIVVYNVTSGQVLIGWSDSHVITKCILTYEVEYSSESLYGPYVRVNDYDIIVTAFTFIPVPSLGDTQVMGFYRIRAVNYWGDGGIYSVPVKYPG